MWWARLTDVRLLTWLTVSLWAFCWRESNVTYCIFYLFYLLLLALLSCIWVFFIQFFSFKMNSICLFTFGAVVSSSSTNNGITLLEQWVQFVLTLEVDNLSECHVMFMVLYDDAFSVMLHHLVEVAHTQGVCFCSTRLTTKQKWVTLYFSEISAVVILFTLFIYLSIFSVRTPNVHSCHECQIRQTSRGKRPAAKTCGCIFYVTYSLLLSGAEVCGRCSDCWRSHAVAPGTRLHPRRPPCPRRWSGCGRI